MKLGIFGGSFDPVHSGHLALARACQQQADLDQVWFTPTAIQPLKQQGHRASEAQRVEMLDLALAAEPSWRVCRLEIERGGLSYTVDTLRQIHTELPDATLFFPLGSDTLPDVPQWREPEEIFRLATPLVVRRAGQPQPDLEGLERLCQPQTQPRLVDMPAVDVSSREIRRSVAAGEPIDDHTPAAVSRYIAEHRLYREVDGH